MQVRRIRTVDVQEGYIVDRATVSAEWWSRFVVKEQIEQPTDS